MRRFKSKLDVLFINGEMSNYGRLFPFQNQVAYEKIEFLLWFSRKGDLLNGILDVMSESSGLSQFLEYEIEYKNGLRSGFAKRYDKDGNILYDYNFLDGKEHGHCIEFSNEGIIIAEKELIYGICKWKKSFWKNGMISIISKRHYKDQYFDKSGSAITYEEFNEIIKQQKRQDGVKVNYGLSRKL